MICRSNDIAPIMHVVLQLNIQVSHILHAVELRIFWYLILHAIKLGNIQCILHAVELGNNQVSHPACHKTLEYQSILSCMPWNQGMIRYIFLHAVELWNIQVSYPACRRTREYTCIVSCMPLNQLEYPGFVSCMMKNQGPKESLFIMIKGTVHLFG